MSMKGLGLQCRKSAQKPVRRLIAVGEVNCDIRDGEIHMQSLSECWEDVGGGYMYWGKGKFDWMLVGVGFA